VSSAQLSAERSTEAEGTRAAGRLFRVFVSSTFADLALERDALRDCAFRCLRDLCAEHGAHFQPVDLRWGVSEEATFDQQAVEICLEEIARSQRLTPRPNFVLLLGDRYGWRPLPARIDAEELERLRPHLDPEATDLVGSWYREDWNAVPPEFVLRPRGGAFENEKEWEPLERKMHTGLAAAAQAAGLGERALRRYVASVTEQEAAAGIFDAPDAREHVHCFFRSARVSGDDAEGEAALVRLKGELRTFLGEDRIHRFETRSELCDDVYAALSSVIESELAQPDELDAFGRERAEHDAFGAERSRDFVGREQPRRAVAADLAGPGGAPLALVGPSGVGKTAFMARAAADAAEAQRQAAVVVRFAGATGRASELRTLLQDLLVELRHARDSAAEEVPAGYQDLVEAFRDELAHERPRAVLLFVDGLDQLGTAGRAVDLGWLPSKLPDAVRVVVSAAEGPVAALLERRLGTERLVRLEPMPYDEGAEMLDAWLAAAHRKLKPGQRKEVLRSFAANGLPLHLRLACEEARRWPSFAPKEETVLADDVPGVIRDLFVRLDRNHGELLVSRSLAYLAAARNGLSEDELLDLLSEDGEVVGEFRKRSPRSPVTNRIPDVVWSRLFSDLEPYLNERRLDGRVLLGFYHRQLAEVVEASFLSGDDGRSRHAALAAYFGRQPLEASGRSGVTPNLRKLSELPFQQTRAGLWDELFATLTDFDFLERKVAAYEPDEHVGPQGRVTRTYPGVFLLQDDFELALDRWPADA
jgi:NACHT domain- and WD repeat-containing protein